MHMGQLAFVRNSRRHSGCYCLYKIDESSRSSQEVAWTAQILLSKEAHIYASRVLGKECFVRSKYLPNMIN